MLRKYSLPIPAERLLRDDLKLGHADVLPQTLDQEEDKLTESAVRSGLIPAAYLQVCMRLFRVTSPLALKNERNETLSAIEIFGEQLLDQSIITSIKRNLLSLSKRSRDTRAVTRSRPKITYRSSLSKDEILKQISSSDSMRRLCQQNYLDPKIKNDIFSDFIRNNVPKTKASWLLKLLWFNERMDVTDKIREWTRAIQQMLQEQLTTICSRTSASNAKKSDVKRELYSLSLAKWLFDEGMIDQKSFLMWSLTELRKANFDQTNMLMPLMTFLSPEVSRSRALIRHLLDISTSKLKKLKGLPESLEGSLLQQNYIRQITKDIIVGDPSNIITPTLRSSIDSDILNQNEDPKFESHPSSLDNTISDLLNSFILNLLYGNEHSDTLSSLESKIKADYGSFQVITLIKSIMNWAITSKRICLEKRSLAQGLIHKILSSEGSDSHQILQAILDDLLNSELPGGDAFQRLVLLYSSFVTVSKFSYSRLIQRLIARGVDYPMHSKNLDVYLRFLSELPVLGYSLNNLNSRNSILANYFDLSNEEKELARAREIIMELLPYMFKNGSLDTSLSQPVSNCNSDRLRSLEIDFKPKFGSMSQYNKSSTCLWLHNQVVSFTVQNNVLSGTNWRSQIAGLPVGSSLLNARQYVTIMWIYLALDSEDFMIETSLWLLKSIPNRLVVLKIVDTFRWFHVYLYVSGKLGVCYRALSDWVELCREPRQKGKRGSSELAVLNHMKFLVSLKDCQAEDTMIEYIRQELESDLKKPAKDRATDFQEIKVLHDDPLSIATAVSNLAYRYSFCKEASKKIFLYSLDTLKKQCTAPDFRRRCEIIVEVLRDYNEYGGYLEGLIIEHMHEVLRSGKLSDLSRPGLLLAQNLQIGWFGNVLQQFIIQKCCSLDVVLGFLQAALRQIIRDFPTMKGPDSDSLCLLFSLIHVSFIAGTKIKDPAFMLTREDIHSLEAARFCDLKRISNFELLSDVFISVLKIYSIAKLEKAGIIILLYDRFLGTMLHPESWILSYFCNNISAAEGFFIRILESLRDYFKLREPSQKQKIQSQKTVKLGQWKEYLFTVFEFIQSTLSVVSKGECSPADVLRLPETRLEYLKSILNDLNTVTIAIKKYQIKYLWDQVTFMDPKFTGDSLIGVDIAEATSLIEALTESMVGNPSAGLVLITELGFFPLAFNNLLLRHLKKYIDPLNVLGVTSLPVKGLSSEAMDMVVKMICSSVSILWASKSKQPTATTDPIDLELKGLGASLLKDLNGFLAQIRVYNAMDAYGVSLAVAIQSLSDVDSSDPSITRRNEEANRFANIYISDIRRRLLNHVRLMLAIVPLMVAHWKEYDMVSYIHILVLLSTSRVVSGENTGILSHSVIGLASWMCDEMSNTEFNKALLWRLRECQIKLGGHTNGFEMISRLLPFQGSAMYLNNIIGISRQRDLENSGSSSIVPSIVSPYKIGYRPSEWLEMLDYVSLSSTPDNVHTPSNTKPSPLEHISSISLSLFNATEVVNTRHTYEELFQDSWTLSSEESAHFNWCTIPIVANSDEGRPSGGRNMNLMEWDTAGEGTSAKRYNTLDSKNDRLTKRPRYL
ncbi:RNA polymerase II mediator complex subunit [Dinochytrium kinnereticum]|nr:RNA polymerase II mediator complex subunit [Dinochytrium kinnereticum]